MSATEPLVPLAVRQSHARESDDVRLGASVRVAVTGANGFIGSHLVGALRRRGISVLALVRRRSQDDSHVLADLARPDALAAVLEGVDILVHCAGLAHAHDEQLGDDEVHMVVNCSYVLNSARAAVRAGVKRFVFCSSVKAMGDPGTQCVDETFGGAPTTAYGRAKRAAEVGLMAISAQTGLQTVILRLAMVYGPGSRGNLERMLRLVARGLFPPLPETRNRRSMVHVSDAVDAIILAALHPNAAGHTFVVAHPRAISGRELYDSMREVCQKPKRRWAVPAWVLRVAGWGGDLSRKCFNVKTSLDSQSVSRLLDSACYSSAAVQTELGWVPRTDIAEGIAGLISNGNFGRAHGAYGKESD